jgi:uncharacterized protein (DUF433 family)
VKPSVVTVDPEIMSGAPCFAGTRVLIQSLFDYLECGRTVSDFLEDFPSVTSEQVHRLLAEARKRVSAVAEE